MRTKYSSSRGLSTDYKVASTEDFDGRGAHPAVFSQAEGVERTARRQDSRTDSTAKAQETEVTCDKQDPGEKQTEAGLVAAGHSDGAAGERAPGSVPGLESFCAARARPRRAPQPEFLR